ncbi:DUF4234 domain-containing protein [Vallitalea okinawensis]|uniref:DUF4234 domain-containing protein n=1 Tax=Vallitalea okinawensis TaxID=2078660 RepID=UPI000CFD5CA3|nr:DUF4234 domain-containing protein [Vallitalea okinawensis]
MYKDKVRSIPVVLILSIVTCGIYMFYWIYSISESLKHYLDDTEISPGVDVVLSILCFYPYSIYYSYKLGQKQMDAQRRAGVPVTDDTVLYVVLAVLGFFIVNQLIVQSKLNEVWNNAV